MNRRSLIKSVGLGFASTATAPLLSLAATHKGNEDNKVGFALVGLGAFASFVASQLRFADKCRVAAVVSSSVTKAAEFIEKHKLQNCTIYHYDDIAQLGKNRSVQAVYIATPVGTHSDLAVRALQAGKHVLIEKTMAASLAQGQSIMAAARQHNRKVMVAYRARYEPYNQACIDLVQQQTYGRVVAIAVHKGFDIGTNLGKNNWRTNRTLSGGGALVDIGIYSIQASRYLAGCEPGEVFGFTHSTPGDARFGEVEENMSFMLRFPTGVLATGSASWSYYLQNHFRVATTKGFIQLEPATSDGSLRMVVKQENPVMVGERFYPNARQIPAMFDHFAACIIEDKQPKTDGDAGLRDLRVLEAIYQSVAENRPVKLPI